MSEKVKVTREQAEGIESIKNTILKNIAELKHFPARFYEEERPVSELDLKDIESALFDGYEVEEEWQTGDWVVYKNEYHTCVMKVIGVSGDFIDVEPYHEGFKELNRICVRSPLIRHATEQEIAQEKKRRFWAGIDREVDEYRVGDIVLQKHDEFVDVIEKINPDNYFYLECSMEDAEIDDLLLVTPAEQRLDQ